MQVIAISYRMNKCMGISVFDIPKDVPWLDERQQFISPNALSKFIFKDKGVVGDEIRVRRLPAILAYFL